jgi:hypothetical protein
MQQVMCISWILIKEFSKMFRWAHQLILICSTCVMWISAHIYLFASLVSYKSSINKFVAQWLITCTFNENVKIIHGHSHSTTNKMHLLSQIIYSCKMLYVFRTVFPSIIRSSKLRTQQRYMSKQLLLSGMRFHLIHDSSGYSPVETWWHMVTHGRGSKG